MAVIAKAEVTISDIIDGIDGKGITSTVITYQAGTSGTTAPTDTWSTAIPYVSPGQYLWSRTVITYSEGNPSTTYSVSYIPKNGTDGATGSQGPTGPTGTGIASITQQYYLSTSKTTQTGGSWVTSMPTWSSGKYLWTRYLITYKNPTSTTYTSPVCDSSWEAVNEIQIGGRNLVLKSDVDYKNKDYLIAPYKLNSAESLKEGDIVTIQIKGTLGADKTHFAVYSDDGGAHVIDILKPNDKGIYTTTVTWSYERLDGTMAIPAGNMNIYAAPSSGTSESFIDWVKLEKGNKATDWTPAPEDLESELDDLGNSLQQSISDQNTNILSNCENIILEALTEYTKSNDFNTFKETTISQLKLLSDQMTLNFKQSTQEMSNINKDLQDKFNTITKYFNFDINGLTIGQTESPYKVIIDNDRYSMTVNDVEVMWIANGKVYTPEIEVTKGFKLFGYTIDQDENGNVNMEYTGGN